eukprot:366569-Chlamydomonas_euryale.AAC.22
MSRSWMCQSVGMSKLPWRPRLQPRLASWSSPKLPSRQGHAACEAREVRRASEARLTIFRRRW